MRKRTDWTTVFFIGQIVVLDLSKRDKPVGRFVIAKVAEVGADSVCVTLGIHQGKLDKFSNLTEARTLASTEVVGEGRHQLIITDPLSISFQGIHQRGR